MAPARALALLEGSDGALYGTTDPDGAAGLSTVFTLRKDGTEYSLLATFPNFPNGPLWESSDGALYGLTQEYRLFKVNKDGSGYNELKTFTGDAVEGGSPASELVEGRDGALYGVNTAGSASGQGTLFKLNKDGKGFKILLNFSDPPITPPLLGSDGALYGTTVFGGDQNSGTVYRFGQAISLIKTPAEALLGLTGIPGYTYELQRSSDLTSWTNLSALLMPTLPRVLFTDSNSPPNAAFYRLGGN